MKKDKYTIIAKILFVLFIIIFSPMILVGLLIWFLFVFLPSPIEKAIYKKSNYYNEYKIKYHWWCTHYDEYILFNKLTKKHEGIKFINYKEFQNYVIEYKNKLFVFLECEFLYFDEETNNWKISYYENDDSKNEEIDYGLSNEHEDLKEYADLDDRLNEIMNKLNIDLTSKEYYLVFNKYVLSKKNIGLLKEKKNIVEYNGVYNLVKKINSLLEKK